MSTENNFSTPQASINFASPQLSRRSGTLYGSTKSAKSTIYGSLAETIYESPQSSPRSTSSGTNSTQKLGDSIQVKKSSLLANEEHGASICILGVNFINILQEAFVPIFLHQTITKANCNERKAEQSTFVKKGEHKMLMKLTTALFQA